MIGEPELTSSEVAAQAHDEVVDALLAPSGDDIVTLVELLNECRNVIGIVLKVAVHGKDVLAGGVIETGRQCRRLTEVPPQLDYKHAAVHGSYLLKQFVGPVSRTIVDQYHLEAV